jgi:hypothetical protein
MGIWGKIILYKYISVWMITEGVCITNGSDYLSIYRLKITYYLFLIHQG